MESLKLNPSGNEFFMHIGVSKAHFSSSNKEEILKNIESELRIILRQTLKGKVSKPVSVELTPELSKAIMNSLRSSLKDIALITV